MKLTQKGSGTHTSVWRRAGPLALVVVMAANLVGAGTVLASDGDPGWAKKAGGNGQDSGNGIAALPDGGALVTGHFNTTAMFDATTSLTSAGGSDICVARYASNGTLTWAKGAGGGGFDVGYGVATLSNGSAVVTGYFQGTAGSPATFDGTTLISEAGSYDVFVAKYDADGILEWVTSAGGGNNDAGHSVAILSEEIGGIIVESAVVTGRFQGTATFGALEPNETPLTSAGSRDIFVAKYNLVDGTLEWATKAGGISLDEGNGISTAPDGSILVSGSFLGTAKFYSADPPSPEEPPTVTSPGNVDIFVAKYNPDGTAVWAAKAGGTTEHRGTGVAALDNGGALVSGYFMALDGSYDVLVAKFDADGTPAWATQAGGATEDMGTGVAALDDGGALVSAYFMASDGSYDVLVAKYNAADGTPAWETQAGGASSDAMAYGIAALSDGSALVTGSFDGAATFDGTTLTSAGDVDIFVAKLGGQLEVEIDIRPGADPNVVNLGSHGVIPVAILSSAEFDATEVDPETVVLAGAGVAVRGRGNRLMAHEEDVNEDGLLDLWVQVETENLDPSQFQDGYASVTGLTYDGVAIIGWDEITIVPVVE